MPSYIPAFANNDTLDSKRRRFQPPITTFFQATSETTHGHPACSPYLSHTHYSATTYSPTPALPEKIQSSLLSVGMRVRKSVAEGYKTKIEKTVDEVKPTQTLYSVPPRPYATARAELTPFSGMGRPSHITATQPFAEPLGDETGEQLITDDGDAFSLPPSSQESAMSTRTQSTGKKRSYDSDSDMDEYEESSFASGMTNWLDPSSLRSITKASPVIGRTILSPGLGWQRRKFVAAQKQGAMEMDDFEEPSFLRRREEVDMEYVLPRNSDDEVQMGGV